MTDKIQKIKEEIKRLKKESRISSFHYYEYDDGYADSCNQILQFIDSLPEQSGCEVNCTTKNEDLEEAMELSVSEEPLLEFFATGQPAIGAYGKDSLRNQFEAGAEWQKQKDEKLFKDDSWNYIEENYPNICQEEKLRLYDISIKSRLAGANAIKQQMKEVLQTEYEKGRFDMREEMIKALVNGEIVKDIHNQLSVKSEPLNDAFRDSKFGEKVKIIIVKEEQQ